MDISQRSQVELAVEVLTDLIPVVKGNGGTASRYTVLELESAISMLTHALNNTEPRLI